MPLFFVLPLALVQRCWLPETRSEQYYSSIELEEERQSQAKLLQGNDQGILRKYYKGRWSS